MTLRHNAANCKPAMQAGIGSLGEADAGFFTKKQNQIINQYV